MALLRNNNKLKKIVIVILALLILFIIALIVVYIRMPKDELPDVSEILEYHNSTLIKQEKSTEDGFKEDIYANLKFPPIEDDGYPEQIFYENVIYDLAAKLQTSYRIIDEDKNVIVRVHYDNKNYDPYYTINDDADYFTRQQAIKQNELAKNNTTSLTINSSELNSIINNNWNRRSSKLGNVISNVNNYDIYNDGYKIKTLGSEVFNVVFTSSYTKPVINGLTTNMDNSKIKSKLGEPFYTYSNDNLIGYRSNDIYAFFSNGEISIYRINKLDEDKNKKFASLVSKLNKDGDVTNFYNNLILLYPNPSESEESEDGISAFYPNLGFKVTFAKDNNGITIYSNYLGKITEDTTMDDLKKGDVPVNVDLEISTDAISWSEMLRFLDETDHRRTNNSSAYISTSKFQVIKNDSTNSYDFYSIDKASFDSSITINKGMDILKYNETQFVYSIPNKGIYLYDASNLNTITLLTGTDDFNIEKIENNYIYYDGKTLKIG